MKTSFVLVIILTCIFLISKTTSAASPNMESTRFRIQSGNINMGSNNETSSSYKIATTLGQTSAGSFSSAGYIVKAGFQYIHSIIPFRFTVSNSAVQFGNINPSTLSSSTINLTVSFGGAGSYQVTAEEIGPMQTLGGTTLTDTTCNGGAETCNESTAKLWNSTSAYGFGYNMSCDNVAVPGPPCSTDLPVDFTSSNHYRPFPDRTAGETPQVVMSSSNVTQYYDISDSNINTTRNTHQATMKFGINVSNTQPAGTYQTVINFIATPSF